MQKLTKFARIKSLEIQFNHQVINEIQVSKQLEFIAVGQDRKLFPHL